MKFPNMQPVYNFFGGFGEFMTVVPLVAAIVLAWFGKLNEAFAAALTAIGGFGVIHDQLGQYQDRKDRQQNGDNSGNVAH